MKKGIMLLTVIMAASGLIYLLQPQKNISGHLNINQALAEELVLLPCIDSALANNIVAYRQFNGPFVTIDELKNIKGMSPAKLEDLRPCLTLTGPTEIVVSSAEMRINPFPRILDEIRCADSLGIIREACTR